MTAILMPGSPQRWPNSGEMRPIPATSYFLHRLNGGETHLYGPDGRPYAITRQRDHTGVALVGNTRAEAWLDAQTRVIPARSKP